MNNNDWTRFVKRISISVDIKKVYEAWATQEGLETWFLRKAEFTTSANESKDRNSPIEKNDRYEWMWHGHPDTVVERKTILDANGKDFLRFSFSGDCIVSVNIKKEEQETIVQLIQENIPVDENPQTNLYVGCGEGWTFYLTNLKSVLEGGVDLRNKNVHILNVINA